MMHSLRIARGRHPQECTIQMFVGGVDKWDTLQGIALLKTYSRPEALDRLHHTLEAETPIGRSLLNEFFNKLMQSERKQEIAKAKLKKGQTTIKCPNQPTTSAGRGEKLQWLPLPKQQLYPQDLLLSHHLRLMFREKRKWGDRLGLLSPNPCHQLQLQLQHQRKLLHQNPL